MKFKYLASRIVGYVATIVLILICNFILIRLMPGDPMMYILGEEDYYDFYYNDQEFLEVLRENYGLNGSISDQLKVYVNDVLHLDFGTSYHYGKPVLEVILFRVKWTFILVLPAILLSSILGIVVGLPAGWNSGKFGERAGTMFFTILHTIPTYCLSIILLSIFSYKLGWLPLGGMVSGGKHGLKYLLDLLRHMILPVGVLVLYRTSYNYLILRSSVRDIREEPYITTAFSKGLTSKRVLMKHVLPNAILPYITAVCMQIGGAIAGTMTMEIIYNWKGMGRLIYDAVSERDFPIIQTCFLFVAVCVILANLLADILYVTVDPRLRKEEKTKDEDKKALER